MDLLTGCGSCCYCFSWVHSLCFVIFCSFPLSCLPVCICTALFLFMLSSFIFQITTIDLFSSIPSSKWHANHRFHPRKSNNVQSENTRLRIPNQKLHSIVNKPFSSWFFRNIDESIFILYSIRA